MKRKGERGKEKHSTRAKGTRIMYFICEILTVRKPYCSLGTWNLELGTWNLELGTWNLELGTWNLELGT